MKQVTNHLKRIVTLTNTHGISPDGVNPANTEDELDYVESKIRFNAIEALRILNSEDKGEGNKPSTKSSCEKVDLCFVGFTNGSQISYAMESDGEGAFYFDSKNECYIPVYMLKAHLHRIETTSNGEFTAEMIGLK